jgi:hypothetical protein
MATGGRAVTEQDFPELPAVERRGALVAYLEYVIREAVAEAMQHLSPDEIREIIEKELADE